MVYPVDPPRQAGSDATLDAVLRCVQGAWAETLGLTDDGSIVAGPCFRFPGLPTWTMCLPDLILDHSGAWRATEVNVSNAAGTSSHLADLCRVHHEIGTLFARGTALPDGSALLRPYSPDTRSTPEILVRAGVVGGLLRATTGRATSMATAKSRTLAEDGLVVVVDDIPSLAHQLRLEGSALFYRDRPVVFLNNPNLLVELARRTHTPVATILEGLNSDVLHEGKTMAALGLDKVRQQELCAGTLLVPVAAQRCDKMEEVVDVALAMADTYGGSVIKPDAASGGTGVVPVDPDASRDEVEQELLVATKKLAAKYGTNWSETCRLAVYEFVHAQPAESADGPRRWDLRLEVLVSPLETVVTPLSARLCPSPIGKRICRADSVGNQTDRSKGEAEAISPLDLCKRVGVPASALEQAASAAYDWVQRAVAPQ